MIVSALFSALFHREVPRGVWLSAEETNELHWNIVNHVRQSVYHPHERDCAW